MKKIRYGIAIVFALFLFAAPVSAQEGCKAGKSVYLFSPDPSSYKQIPKDEAVKMKNYISSDQYKASIKPDSLPTKPLERGPIER
jgi:hypothetical protein